jgi:hypothetical protein
MIMVCIKDLCYVQNYPVAGAFYSIICKCGGKPDGGNFLRLGASDNCIVPCGGEEGTICGGLDSISIYTTKRVGVLAGETPMPHSWRWHNAAREIIVPGILVMVTHLCSFDFEIKGPIKGNYTLKGFCCLTKCTLDLNDLSLACV